MAKKQNMPVPPKPKAKPKTKAKAKPKAKPKPEVEVETMNKALRGLGYMFNIKAEGRFTPANLNKLLATNKLDIVTTERSYVNAIQMACKRTKGETSNDEPFKVEELHKDNSGITVAYYERERTFKDGKVILGKYVMKCKAYFDKDTSEWLSKPPELEACGYFKKVIRYKQYLFGGDLRYWIFDKLFTKMKCVPSIGGMKFIPQDEVEIYNNMISFCQDANIDYRSYTQMADDETKKALAKDVRGTLSQALKDIGIKINEIMSKEKPRRDSVENAKAKLANCEKELQMMSKLLGFQMQDVNDAITDLQNKIDGVKITPKSASKRDTYKDALNYWISTDRYEIAAGVYVIPFEVAIGAGVKRPANGKPLSHSVLGAMAELGLFGSYQGDKLIIKQVKVNEVNF